MTKDAPWLSQQTEESEGGSWAVGTTAEETLASLSTWLCPSGVHFMREKTMIQRSGKHDGDRPRLYFQEA